MGASLIHLDEDFVSHAWAESWFGALLFEPQFVAEDLVLFFLAINITS